MAEEATLLRDGRVLFVGGFDVAAYVATKGTGYLVTCEILDPATLTISPTGSIKTGRLVGSVVTLMDGRVLVAGGVGHDDPPNLSSAELYQP